MRTLRSWSLALAVLATPPLCADTLDSHSHEEEQGLRTDPKLTLGAACDAAWDRWPGRRALQSGALAADAYDRQSRSLTSGPPELTAIHLNDALLSREQVTETQFGLEFPLWRPGQRKRLAEHAEVYRATLAADEALQRWELTGAVREAYWGVREAEAQLAQAEEALSAFLRLERDVNQRIAAGDAAPSERLLAEEKRRLKETLLHEARAALVDQVFNWNAVTGLDVIPSTAEETPISPAPDRYVPLEAAAAASARAEASLRSAESAGAGAPRIALGSRINTQSGGVGLTVIGAQLSIPFGGESHRNAALAPMAVAAAAAQDQLARIEREASLAQHEAGHALHLAEQSLVDARTRLQLVEAHTSTARRAHLLGESSLSERLLAEANSAEASRALALAVINRARAIARFNQVHGALP